MLLGSATLAFRCRDSELHSATQGPSVDCHASKLCAAGRVVREDGSSPCGKGYGDHTPSLRGSKACLSCGKALSLMHSSKQVLWALADGLRLMTTRFSGFVLWT